MIYLFILDAYIYVIYLFIGEYIFTVREIQYRKNTRNCIDYIKTDSLYHYVFYSEKKAQLVIYCNMTTTTKHTGKSLSLKSRNSNLESN